jgi:GAF domain-containing protein
MEGQVRRRRTANRKPAKAQQTIKAKRGAASKAARSRRPSVLSKDTDVTRLARERDDAVEQLSATSEVLKLISSSPGDLQAVFAAILANAVRICDAKFGMLMLHSKSEGSFDARVMVGAPPALVDALLQKPFKPQPGVPLDRMMRTKKAVHTIDAAAEHAKPRSVELAGARTHITVPILKQNELIGALSIFRQEVRPFTDKQIELVSNFAAQAVIAIENTRLLNELRQRTDDLSESLEQQTATAEVLQVISSSRGELEPVFQAMLANAMRVCEAKFGFTNRYDGDTWKIAAVHGAVPAYTEYLQQHGYKRPGPETVVARIARTKRIVHIADLAASQGYAERDPVVVAAVELGGVRTMLGVPMLKEDKLIGAILLYRQEVWPFTEKQIELVTNFAAQAVIAIENTRLLSELRESLQQQTATADVLKVISRSTFDLQAVLHTLVESAQRLCEADSVFLYRRDGASYHWGAGYGLSREFREFIKDYVENRHMPPGRGSVVGRVALERATVHIPDVLADPEYTWSEGQEAGKFRSVLGVPLLREGALIGVLAVTRTRVQPFTEKLLTLLAASSPLPIAPKGAEGADDGLPVSM